MKYIMCTTFVIKKFQVHETVIVIAHKRPGYQQVIPQTSSTSFTPGQSNPVETKSMEATTPELIENINLVVHTHLP